MPTTDPLKLDDELKAPKDEGIVKSVTETTQPEYKDDALSPTPEEAPVATTLDQPTVKPEMGEVKQETDTVAGQMDTLLKSDSPYIEQAKEDAMRSANTRGLINSSIAAGAGTEAAIKQALPIAQTDAQIYSQQRLENQQASNEFLENEQSAALNKEIAAFEQLLAMESEAYSAQLKTEMDLVLQNQKLSDEMKLQYVSTINNIARDAQEQITEIGLSDRSAAQQAAAIEMVLANRDAEIAVYQDLLEDMDDWEWSTEFTPESVSVAEQNNYWNAPGNVKLTEEPRVGTIIDGQVYKGGGLWEPEGQDQYTTETGGGGWPSFNQ